MEEVYRLRLVYSQGCSRLGACVVIMKSPRLFTLFIAITVVISCWAHAKNFHRTVIRGDGQGYYEYLPAMLAYDDPWLQRLDERPDAPRLKYMLSWATIPLGGGRSMIIYPMGTAILWCPFYAMASLFCKLFPICPMDSYSPPYQIAVSIAATFYLVLALIILFHLGRKLQLTPPPIVLSLIGIVYATNLFHYATFDACFSHVYSFFSVALWIFCVDRFYERPDIGNAIFLGIALGMVFLVRHSNIIVGMLFAAYYIQSMPTGQPFCLRLPVAAAAFTATIFPQLLYYYKATGHWFLSTYAMSGHFFINARDPKIFRVLLGMSNGVLFWSPFIAVTLIGAIKGILRGPTRWVNASIFFIFCVQTLLIASWGFPNMGCAFGHRGFIDILPLCFLSLLSLFQAPPAPNVKRYAVLAIVTFTCVLYTSLLMRGYWNGIIPIEHTKLDQWRRALIFWN